MTTFSSLATQEVVSNISCGAANDDEIGIVLFFNMYIDGFVQERQTPVC